MINAKRLRKIGMAAILFVGLCGVWSNGGDMPPTTPTKEKLEYFLDSCFSEERGAADFNNLKVSFPPDAEFGEQAGKKGIHLRGTPVTLDINNGTCKDGFSFSFDLAPLWYGDDSIGWHPIISFDCRDAKGERFNIDLVKHSNGSLYFLDKDGFINIGDSVMWLKGRWAHVSGGCGTKGLYISTEGSVPTPQIVGPDVATVERVTLGGVREGTSADLYIGNLVIKNGANAVAEESPNDASYAPLRVAPGARWSVSPDLPCRLTGYIKRFEKDFQAREAFVFLECPEGIMPGEIMDFNLYGLYSNRTYYPPWVYTIIREGKNYQRYYYPVPSAFLTLPNSYGTRFNIQVTLSTTLPYGPEAEVGLGVTSVNGGKDEPMARMPVRVVQIGPRPSLHRLRVGLSQWRNDLRVQGDYVAFARRLGLNFLDLWIDSPPGIESAETLQPVDEVVYRLRQAGIQPVLSAHYQTAFRGVPPDAQCMNIDGGRIGGRCLSDRGPEYLKDMDNCRNIAARSGGLSFDLELPGFYKHDGCFCPRCLSAFQNYLKTNHPNLVGADPKQFEKDWKSNPEQNKAWEDFIGAQASEWAYAYYQASDDGFRKAGGKDAEPFMLYYDEGMWTMADMSRLFAKPRNKTRLFASPPLYHNGEWVGKELRRYITLYPNVDVMPYTGFESEGNIVDMRSKVLEIFGSGAKGILFFLGGGIQLDAEAIREIIEGLNAVSKIEDILADGRPIPGVKAEPEGANTAVVGGAAKPVVLLVSWYKPIVTPVTVTLPFPVSGDIVDLLTGETVIKLNAPSTVLTFPKIEDGARLYRCERKSAANN